MASTPNTLNVCRTTFLYEDGGTPGIVRAGQIVRDGHPILDGHEDMFSPLVVDFEMPPVGERKPLPRPRVTSSR